MVTLPAQKELLNAVFATDAGVENDPIDAQDDGVIWYEVLGVVPEQLKPFDQVKDEVAKDWRAEEARTKAAKYAQDLVNSLNGGKTLEDIAKDLNVEVLTSDPLKRESITVNVLPASVAQAFALPEKGYGSGPSGVDEGRIVFQVDKVTPPEPLSATKDLERLNKQVGLLMSQDAIDEYSESAGKPLRRHRQSAGPRQAHRPRRGAMSSAKASVTQLRAARRGSPHRAGLSELRTPLRRRRAAGGLDPPGRRSRDAGFGHAQTRA